MIRLMMVCVFLISQAAGAWAQAKQESYKIEAGDQLAISVLEDPGLNATVLVRPDGRISLPLAGTITVEGRTPEEVQTVIRRNLARDFVTPPTVTVSVASLGRATVFPAFYIVGEVSQPGRYEMAEPVDILQALAIAGGPGVFAATSRIQLRRKDLSGETVTTFDYDLVEQGRTPIANVELMDGDVIVIPQRGLFE